MCKVRKSICQKEWWYNIRKYRLDCKHKSVSNNFRWIHMVNKMRIDRMSCYSRCWIWK